ncbi:MAG: phthiocerol/phthiodiolone dimycocerosyl transferase family protein [Candidatus Competibacteraceae bacterium]
MKRLLGPEEFKLWLFNRRSPFNVVVAARLTGRLEIVALQQAVVKLPSSHPLLSAQIECHGRPRLVTTPALPLPLEIETREDDDHWRRVLEQELNRRLPVAEGPLLRVTLLHGAEASDLILCACHVATDALGVFTLLRDLLALLAGDEITPRMPMPAFEELIPAEAFGAADGAALRDQWWSRQTSERLAAVDWDDLAGRLPDVGKTRVLADELDQETTAALLARCRAEQTTVHGALSAGVLISLVSEAAEVACTHSVSLRQRLEPPFGDEVGLCLSRVLTRHRIGPDTDFWGLARDVRSRITAAIQCGEPFDRTLETIRVLTPGGRLEIGPEAVATMTNPGLIALEPRQGRLSVRSAISAGTVMVDGPVISTATVAGRLTWLWTIPDHWSRAAESALLSRQAFQFLLS